MKHLLYIIIAVLVMGYPTLGQSDSVCKIRGHIQGIVETTLIYCSSELYDEPDYTVMVQADCNTRTAICIRCGQVYTLPENEPIIIILWQRDPTKTKQDIIEQFKKEHSK